MDPKSELIKIAEENGHKLTDREFADFMDSQKVALSDLRNEFYYPKMKDLPKVDQTLVNPEESSLYFCGHSLGLQPKGVKKYLDRELEKWAKMGVYGHTLGDCPWMLCDEFVIDGTARLIGALPSEVGIMNALTVNLHMLMVSFYRPTASRHKILLESHSFPSDHYAIESQIRFHGFEPSTSMICMEPRQGEHCLRTEDIVNLVESEGESIALVIFSGVQYFTGQLFDIPKITQAGHKKGCVVGWDMAHAIGNVPMNLHDWDVDFAVWCSYKYLNGSAGGISGLFLHEKHANNDYPKLLGWWGHKLESRFQMNNVMDLADGPAGYRVSNPSILQVCAMLASLDVFAKTSMEDLRKKSVLLTTYLEILLNHYLSEKSEDRRTKASCQIITPADPEFRGCQLSMKLFAPNIDLVYHKMQARGIACDRRHSVFRFGAIHLYNSFVDVHRLVETLVTVLLEIDNHTSQDETKDYDLTIM